MRRRLKGLTRLLATKHNDLLLGQVLELQNKLRRACRTSDLLADVAEWPRPPSAVTGHAVVAVDVVPLSSASLADKAGVSENELTVLQGDALSSDFMAEAVGIASNRHGGLDAFFHLVGTYAFAPLTETESDVWQRVLNVNLTSAYVAARSAVSELAASRGLMVFVGARAATTAPANQAAYVASKAGVLAFAQSLAHELHPQGIRVNSIVPDIIDTPANRKSMSKSDSSGWLTTHQVADVLLYLVSDAASGVTGAAINLQRT